MTKNFKLSKSALSLMKECSRCFWLKQHKVWQRPQGIHMTLNNGMDLLLKKHFDKFRANKKMPPEICNEDHLHEMKLFEDTALLKQWRNNFKGVRVEDEEGNILFGAVDEILVKDNKLIVMDYKARGFPIKENTHEVYQEQLDIYTYLLQKNGHDTEEYAFLLFYHPNAVLETGEIVFATELVKMPVDVNNVEKLWKDALTILKGACPTKTCEWCEARGKNGSDNQRSA